jgi:hypothetical protein
MKKRALLSILLFFSLQLLRAQYTFQKFWPEMSCSAICTNDGGFLVSGYSYLAAPQYKAALIRLNAQGDTLWTHVYGDSLVSMATDAFQTTDGGFIFTGVTEIPGGFMFEYDLYVVKTDSMGTPLWSKKYSGGYNHNPECIKQTSDGGYIVCGGTQAYGAGDLDLYVMRLDAAGAVLWTRTIGDADTNYGFSIFQTPDGGFILNGSNVSAGPVYAALLCRIDASGNLLWSKKYPGTRDGYGLELLSNGFLLTGRSTGTAQNPFLIKTDTLGNVLFAKKYSSTGPTHSVKKTEDGGYVLTGFGTVIIKTDSLGAVEWARLYQPDSVNVHFGETIQQAADKGYIVAAILQWPPLAQDRRLHLIKTDSLGFTGCLENAIIITDSLVSFTAVPQTFASSTGGIEIPVATVTGCVCSSDSTLCGGTVNVPEEQTLPGILLYPNPSSGAIQVTFKGPAKDGNYKVFTIAGDLVKSGGFTEKEFVIESPDLNPGLYIIHLRSGTYSYAAKIIIQ